MTAWSDRAIAKPRRSFTLSQFNVGDVKISRIVESEGPWDGTFLLPDATGENVQKERDWLYPTFSDERGNLRMSIHSIVIESQGKRIIVDTCIGNDKVRSNPAWNKLQLPYLEDLRKLGHAREAIDHVICTHLHIDHVGWNTMLKDGKWVADLPQRQISGWRHRMGFLLAIGRSVFQRSGGRFSASCDGRRARRFGR